MKPKISSNTRTHITLLAINLSLPNLLLAQSPVTPDPTLEKVPPKAVPVEQPTNDVTPPETNVPAAAVSPGLTTPHKTTTPEDRNLIPDEPKPFIPVGGMASLIDQANIELFTVGKDVGNIQDNPELAYRRLVQRTIMATEPRPDYGFTLTFDDQLVAEEPTWGDAIDIVNDLAPLKARSIFFANVQRVSAKTIDSVFKQHKTSETRLSAIKKLLESRRAEYVETIRSLIKIKCPADAEGNAEYACEVYNHTAFHQNMGSLEVDSDHYKVCIIGIEFIEECLNEAYLAERPDWERARYFRFPFLSAPKLKETQTALNETFTKLGLVSLGETQDSKDYSNGSSKVAYASLAAAKKGRRYNPKFNGVFGRTERPIALFHTKTWPKIKSGVIKAIKEK